MKLLDCTLRDGGYYTGWDFTMSDAVAIIEALARGGIDIIELGYKAQYGACEHGQFRYLDEWMLRDLPKPDGVEFAAMVDVKDAAGTDLDAIIHDAEKSPLDWIRLCSYIEDIDKVPGLISYFKKRGYKVTLNLMQVELLTAAQKSDARVSAYRADVFYLADSLGNFNPDNLKKELMVLSSYFDVGLHLHDNKGLAYGNAISAQVDYLDSSLLGMGRGAGNLATEKFIQCPEIYDVLENIMQPLKDKYKWGPNPAYQYSASMAIHPTYPQVLCSSGMRLKDVISALQSIPGNKRHRVDRGLLNSLKGVSQ